MAKTILIPVDLRVASLNTLKTAMEHYTDEAPAVILMYSEYLSDSITELMFHSPVKILAARTTPEFKEAMEIIGNRFGKRIESLKLKLFNGISTNAFNNFIETNGIDVAFIPKQYKLQTAGQAFDPVPMMRRSALISCIEIDWTPDNRQNEREQLTALFN